MNGLGRALGVLIAALLLTVLVATAAYTLVNVQTGVTTHSGPAPVSGRTR